MFKKKFINKRSIFIVVSVLMVLSFFLANYLVDVFVEAAGYLFDFAKDPKTAKFESIPLESALHFKSKYLIGYSLFYLFILGIILKLIYNYKMNFDDLDKGQHGTREFATVEELKQQYQIIPAKEKEYEGSGGVIIGGLQEPMKPYRLMIDDSPVHTMVIGITRSGKGETFVVPMLDVLSRAKDKPSLVVNDPKGELAGASYETLKKRGYEVHIFNLIDQSMGMGFNPLQLVIDAWKNGNYALAEQYTNSITHSLYSEESGDKSNAFFSNSASSMVAAVILAIVEDAVDKGEEEKVNLYSVVNFIVTMGGQVVNPQTGETAMDRFFSSRSSTNPARMKYGQVELSTGNTLSSIISVAIEKLQIFISEPNARLTSYNSMKLTDVGFGDKPVAIFMVTPDYDESNHVLASIFVSQLYRVNAEKATMESGKMKRHVHFMLDEFGNMPTIDGMSGMVTVGAGRGFRFHLIIQAYSQVQAKYGKEGSDTIIGNCSNQIYILTQDKATAEQYSALLGSKTITDISRSGKLLSFDKSHSESTKERSLLMPDELMQLKEGESVVIRVNKRQDKKRRKIVPKPIYNHGVTEHQFRYQYLANEFDTNVSVLSLPITSADYYNIRLEDIVFTSKPRIKDQYLTLDKLMTGKQFDNLKHHLRVFAQNPLGYENLEEWSPLHLFSHIIYDLRPNKNYFESYLTPRYFDVAQFVADEVIDYWKLQLDFVIDKKGVLLEAPPKPERKGPFGK